MIKICFIYYCISLLFITNGLSEALKIEAENYSLSQGVRLETSKDDGGG